MGFMIFQVSHRSERLSRIPPGIGTGNETRDAPDERMVRSTPGVGSRVPGIRDGRRKTGDGASHGSGILHGRMGTHGVPAADRHQKCMGLLSGPAECLLKTLYHAVQAIFRVFKKIQLFCPLPSRLQQLPAIHLPTVSLQSRTFHFRWRHDLPAEPADTVNPRIRDNTSEHGRTVPKRPLIQEMDLLGSAQMRGKSGSCVGMTFSPHAVTFNHNIVASIIALRSV